MYKPELLYQDEMLKYHARCIRAYCKEHRCATYENNPRIKTYVSEIMITKEAFIEAYNKWIKDPNSSGCEDK